VQKEKGNPVQKPYTLNMLIQKLAEEPDESANAAVAILVKEVQDDLKLLIVKRADVEGDPWSGDIAFPGGKRNLEDLNIYETAKRELLEETGIDLRDIEPIGVMPMEHSMVRRQMKVQPVLFHQKEPIDIQLSYELQSYLWASLKKLKVNKTRGNVKGRIGPIFNYEGEKVWGLTYRMLEKIIDLLDED
jgi:8-oxo-dGTP pyrophosphatase MutT (NUDIX family)